MGRKWTYIDRDDLIEQGLCKEKDANAELEKKIQQISNYVIVDTQIPWREKREGEFYFLIDPPLDTLLQRNTQRALELSWEERFAYYATEYVQETYRALSQMDKTKFDCVLDSTKVSVQIEMMTIKAFIILRHNQYRM